MPATPLVRLTAAFALAASLTACSTGDAGSPAADIAQVAPSAAEDDLDGWSTASPDELGLRARAIDRAATRARRAKSSCFAVVRGDQVAGEWNWESNRGTSREVFSVTKSVAATLVGIAERDGLLSVDDRVAAYVPQWRGTRSADVTIREILSNESGRFWSEESDYVRLVQAKNRTRYAVGLDQQYAPGSSWAYNNAAIQVLDAVLSEATGRPTDEFAEERLFEPLGMTHSRLTRDAGGSTAVFFGMRTTCLDLARFGRLYLEEGVVDGERLLSPRFVRDAVTRPSTEHNAAYGYLWWLNRRGPLRGSLDDLDASGQPLAGGTGQLAPGAPERLYAALGLGGQVLLVDPGTDTLVVRLGPVPQPGEREYGFADAARVVTSAVR